MNISLRLAVFLGSCPAAISLLMPSALAVSLAAFRTCVGAGGTGTTCQLDAGTYTIDNVTNLPITVSRSNITILGSPSTLLRNYPTSGTPVTFNPVMQVASGVSSVTIQNFVFDGNRSNTSLSSNCTHSAICADLYIGPSNAVTVSGNVFKNGSGRPLLIWGSTSATLKNSTLSSNWFLEANMGLLIGGPDNFTGPNNYTDDYQLCTTDSSISGTVGIPNNLTVSGNCFRGHAVGAVALGEVYTAHITYNQLLTSPTDPGGGVGGVIYAQYCDDYVTIDSNFIDDSALTKDAGASGLELYGLNTVITNNVIQNMGGSGIYLGG